MVYSCKKTICYKTYYYSTLLYRGLKSNRGNVMLGLKNTHSYVYISAFFFAVTAFSDSTQVTEIEMNKTVCTDSSSETLGEINCGKLKEIAKKNLIAKGKHIIKTYKDEGLVHVFDPVAGFCRASKTDGTALTVPGPMCDVLSGEAGGACGGWRQFDNNGIIPGTDNAERAIRRGARVSVYVRFLKEVENEINAGKINMHSVAGAYPCGVYSKAIMTAIEGGEAAGGKPGIKQVSTNFKKLFPIKSALTKDTDSSADCTESSNKFFANSKIAEGAKSTSAVSNTFMHICYANKRLQGLFEELVACEFFYRADDFMREKTDIASFVNSTASALVEECQEQGVGDSHWWEDNGNNDDDGNWISNWVKHFDAGKGATKLRNCYNASIQGEVTSNVRDTVNLSASGASAGDYKPYEKMKDSKTGNSVEFPICKPKYGAQ